MTRRTWTDEEFIEAVAKSESIAGTLRFLGLKDVGGNYVTVRKSLARLNLTKPHWTGQAYLKGKTHSRNQSFPVMVEHSTYGTGNLKERLIKLGLLKPVCNICGIQDWVGKPLVLHLDHINGVSDDHRFENLRLLCPNCHSQTDTYCGKNIKSMGHEPKKTEPRVRVKIQAKVCLDCPNQISWKASRCKPCAKKQPTKSPPKINWPSQNDLLEMISMSSVNEVAKQLGVSFPSVKKHAGLMK